VYLIKKFKILKKCKVAFLLSREHISNIISYHIYTLKKIRMSGFRTKVFFFVGHRQFLYDEP